MTRRQSEQLSAWLDGELGAEDVARVRAALAVDPALKAEYDTFARLDAGLRDLAEQSAFTPEIAWAAAAGDTGWSWAMILALAAGALVVRFVPKLLDSALLGLGIEILAAAALSATVLVAARDRQRIIGVDP